MKAVLVLEMPKSCKDCKLTYLDTGDDAYFGVNVQRCIFDDADADTDERYYDCPLKPMPKEEDIYEVGMDEEDTNAKRQWNKGWNACLEEIEK